jgi:hypothetical protein
MNDFEKERTERAKEIFLNHHGNRFYMDHDGTGSEYESYHISKETEEMWTVELADRFLGSKPNGKEALRTYSAVSDMLRRDKQDRRWASCLYYPLRSGHLDDVTKLYMLNDSFKMAERAFAHKQFTKEEAVAYIQELDGYIQRVSDRVKSGNVTRASDYIPQEFSDPVYTEGYLNGLKKKWTALGR